MSKLLKAIAVAEVIGGAVLLAKVAPAPGALLSQGLFWPKALLLLGYLMSVCVLSLIAGVLLWRSGRLGLPLSAATQLLQVPWLDLPRFTYELDMGLSLKLTVDIETGYLGFAAGIGDFFFKIGPSADQQMVIGINFAALAFLIHLLRRMAYERRVRLLGPRAAAALEPPPVSLPRRMLRFTFRLLAVGVAIVVVPMLGWWLYNRFDEAPTAQAQRWFATLPRPANDRDNAWLYLMGFGAAEGDEPTAFGRRRLAAYEARIADHGAAAPSVVEQGLKDDPLPFRKTIDSRGQAFDHACDTRTQDCIAWARRHNAELARLEAGNTTRLRRFEVLLGMSDFTDPSPPAHDSPTSFSSADAELYRALITRDLGQPASRAAALQRLARLAAFWQRANEPAQSRLMRAISERHGEHGMRLLDALLNRADATGLGGLDAAAAVILKAPTPAQRNWEAAIRRESQEFAHTFEHLQHTFKCKSNCLMQWFSLQFYLPQATRNRAAQLADAVLAVHTAEVSEIDAANARVGALREEISIQHASVRESFRRMLHNYAGETLLVRSTPEYADGLYMQHDLEALRRMILIKMSAIRQRVAPAAMPRFLASQPAELRNVYTGQAFEWHAASQQIRFVPKSKRFKLERLSVAYLTGA